jgi:hypothetical protein
MTFDARCQSLHFEMLELYIYIPINSLHVLVCLISKRILVLQVCKNILLKKGIRHFLNQKDFKTHDLLVQFPSLMWSHFCLFYLNKRKW